MNEHYHQPVLLQEVTSALAVQPGIFVDGTLGAGGHSFALLQQLHAAGFGQDSRLIGIDQDDDALREAWARLQPYADRVSIVKGNFGDLSRIIAEVAMQWGGGGPSGIHGLLLDLGISSHQIDTPERGFSYLRDGALDMRMDALAPQSAADIINTYDAHQLAELFFRFGEEPRSRFIAKAVVAYRNRQGPVNRTGELVSIIRSQVAGPERSIKAMTRIFQALRIAVNQEFDVLRCALEDGVAALVPGGRMAVISYHSLEDRMVKSFFGEKAAADWGPKGVGLREPLAYPEVSVLTRKPIIPAPEEVKKNTRSRSAKLRVIVKRKNKNIGE